MSVTMPETGVPTVTTPFSRQSTVVIRGQQVTVGCPPWCVKRHDGETLAVLEDLLHEGAPFEIRVPGIDGTVPALTTRASWWPFARDARDRRPYLAVSLTEGGDGADLYDTAAVERLAGDLEQHAARLRAVARIHLDGNR